MGKLVYGHNNREYEFDDRVLAHLQIVFQSKLRHRDNFFFSWSRTNERGGGRVSLWIDSSIPLAFEYLGGRRPALNRAWLEAMMSSGATVGGLELLPEPADAAPEVGAQKTTTA
jgi:hypothetical protein